MAFSIGVIIASIVYPPLTDLFKNKKWVCLISVLISVGLLLVVAFEQEIIKFGVYFLLFTLIGFLTNGVTGINFSISTDYFNPDLAGTASGLCNFFSIMGIAIEETISSSIIPSGGSITNEETDEKIYMPEGYRNGIWLFSAGACLVAVIAGIFCKDTYKSEE